MCSVRCILLKPIIQIKYVRLQIYSVSPVGTLHFLGHRYGTTLVPFSKIDKDLLSYRAKEKCLSVLGFAKASDVSGALH